MLLYSMADGGADVCRQIAQVLDGLGCENDFVSHSGYIIARIASIRNERETRRHSSANQYLSHTQAERLPPATRAVTIQTASPKISSRQTFPLAAFCLEVNL